MKVEPQECAFPAVFDRRDRASDNFDVNTGLTKREYMATALYPAALTWIAPQVTANVPLVAANVAVMMADALLVALNYVDAEPLETPDLAGLDAARRSAEKARVG